MKKLNKKGFTLIELLAVIIILGVLLLIAVPSVSKYIQQSRMKTYNTNLSKFVDAVSTEVNSMDYSSDYSFSTTEVLVVPFNKIDIERGSNEKSPFSMYDQTRSFVLVTRKYNKTTVNGEDVYTPVGYNYYVQAIDGSGFGTKLALSNATKVEELSTDGLIVIPEPTASEANPTMALPTGIGDLPPTVTTVKVIR